MPKLTPEQMEKIKAMTEEDWTELQVARGVKPSDHKSFADLLQFATSLDTRVAVLEGKPKPAPAGAKKEPSFFGWLLGPA